MNSNGGCVGSDRISTHTLKKGPWTAAEDAILMEYVKKHGEGNWNAVHKNSRLMRCGKSCRLRWTNHLRPNLKKGSFSPLEEKIILQLHAKLGNKWARMAAQLPGRTDNEIKNYWNTRMKRRQRAGLPIHPRQVGDKIAGFLLQLQKIQQCQGRKPPSSSSLSSKFLSTSQGKKHDSMNSSSSGQNQAIPSFYSNLYTSSCCSNNSGFALPLSSPSQLFASPSSNLYKRNINVPLPAPSFQLQCGSSEHGLSFCSLALLMGSQTEPIDLVPELKVDLVSSQTPPQRISTPTSYTNTSSGGVYMVASSGNITNNYFEPMGSSGLLDAILVESRALFCNERNKDGEEFPQVTDKGKAVMDAANVEEEEEEEEGEDAGNNNKCFVEKRWDDFSSSPQSSMGVKPRDESIEEMNSMDDNLLSLLNNIPSSMPLPLPEWYIKIARMPNGSPPVGTTDGNMVFDAEQNDSAAPAATTNLDRALGSRCWKNMPGIC